MVKFNTISSLYVFCFSEKIGLFCPRTSGEGDILFLVRIPLALASALVLTFLCAQYLVN